MTQQAEFIDGMWRDEIVPTLVDYIRIPNKSPAFDPDWALHGHMDRAVDLFAGWAKAKLAALPGSTLEVVRLAERTPLILIEVPGSDPTSADRVLLYGHLDKQPEMVGWLEGYGPWIPRLEGDKLYGRGGADDGYAMFAALTAILSLARERQAPCALPHPHRGLRGILQRRPALLRRPSQRPHRRSLARGLPRFRLRQL